jgi:hypothetical protein
MVPGVGGYSETLPRFVNWCYIAITLVIGFCGSTENVINWQALENVERPEIMKGALAERFAMDDVLEQEFVQSWNHMEWFFGSGEIWPKMVDVVDFIATLRRTGYDRHLRAGQSLEIFVVSRSRKHGLRPEQPSIGFHIYKGKMRVYSKGLHTETFVENAATLSDRVRDLLDRLTDEAIT